MQGSTYFRKDHRRKIKATSQLRHVIFSISNHLMLSGLEAIQTAKSHLKDAYMSPVEEI